MYKTPRVELPTGSLGLGLPAGLEMALEARLKDYDSYIYIIMEDGEIRERCIWEVVMLVFEFEADHLTGTLDSNGVQSDGALEDIMSVGGIRTKWEAFGWSVIPYDDHGAEDIYRVVEEAEIVADKPPLILVKAVEGEGVSLMEGRNI